MWRNVNKRSTLVVGDRESGKWFRVEYLFVLFAVIGFFLNDKALMSFDEEVSSSELSELVHYFSKYPYRARDANSKVIISKHFYENSGLNIVTNLYPQVDFIYDLSRLRRPLLSHFFFSFLFYQIEGIQKKCLQLFSKDYKFTVSQLNSSFVN